MSSFYIGHRLTNLIIPGEPDALTISTRAGSWELRKNSRYGEYKGAIAEGKIAETYTIEISCSYNGSRAAAMDAVEDELIPLCLAASYLTALSVAPSRSLPGSDVSFMQVGPHFPRPRGMGTGFQACPDETSFAHAIADFVATYPTKGMDENIRLIAHHFLDALAFWSLEDLVLSATTILEIIAITAKRVAASQGQTIQDFTPRLAFAAARFNLPDLPPDFRKMRNDLVHEGTLSGQKFPNKDSFACGVAVAEALDWIDEYVFAAVALGKPAQKRFIGDGFRGANSFSLS
jgi:hypothetical protein